MTAVSVIVPFLNAERYLDDAIASVQAQSHRDWELLLIDDGSSDGSPDIAARAAAADSRVRVLGRTADGRPGAAGARNDGLRAATGDYVSFLDADDLYEPHQLSTLLEPFAHHPYVMTVYGPTHWWHPGAEHLDWVEPMGDVAGRAHWPTSLLSRVVLLNRSQVPCTCAVMARRAAVRVVGGFEEAFRLYEDQTLWVKLFTRFPVYVTDVVGARYRQHGESVSAQSAQSGDYHQTGPHPARAVFLAWVRDYALAHGLSDASVERALRIASAVNGDGAGDLTSGDRLAMARTQSTDRARWLVRRSAAYVRRATTARTRQR